MFVYSQVCGSSSYQQQYSVLGDADNALPRPSIMGANRLIFFLCLYRTVPCMDVAKNNGNDGEAASENRTNVGNHDNKERNTDDWDIGLKYLDSLVQKTIDNVSAISDVRGQEQRQQYIADLRDKYASIVDQSTKKIILQEESEQNCFSNDSRGKERPEERRFNRTIAWFRHTALRRLLLNAATKCIFNGTEIPINVERRANDLYLWAVIPQQGHNSSNDLKLMNRNREFSNTQH
ncbi:unnamed protein product [Acanthocheilonema viteae]|uniref:Uncharacterized protein n=1 Tax=Acanthocheilonema viteae TaxID=6277 RepID=A0A498S7V5_ACAVI|nr:unnamed protein product [Acanthocheilonema viteae]